MNMNGQRSNLPFQSAPLPGFWLSKNLCSSLSPAIRFETYHLLGGRLVDPSVPGSVAIESPVLDNEGWAMVFEGLQKARRLDTRQFLARWQSALVNCQPQMAEKLVDFLPLLSTATGYSSEMILHGFLAGSLSQVDSLSGALDFWPRRSSAETWQPLPSESGYARFYPSANLTKFYRLLGPDKPLYRPAPPTKLALGFAAGNVPGTGFLIALLSGLANAAHPALPAPALIIRNSRHEPLFYPWLLDMIEAFDPELTAATAVLAWDYNDIGLQRRLMGSAGLMLAAAGDDTIAALEAVRKTAVPKLRFHRHGHKASFSAIGSDFALSAETSRQAALDSSLWDQNGCLSARVHFVEGDATTYAQNLVEAMRTLAVQLPRGSTPLRFTHRAFDTYHNLENSGKVKVFSQYEDEFAVILDERPWDAILLRRVTNTCQGRTAVVRPIKNLAEAPRYLCLLPPENLQTIGLACGEERILPFAEAAGRAGVTAVRKLGQAAFPQLASSWDGYLPLDAACLRPEGYWTGIETGPSPNPHPFSAERGKLLEAFFLKGD